MNETIKPHRMTLDWHLSMPIELPHDAVHIWQWHQADFLPQLTRLRSLLSDDEQARAQRLVIPQKRDYFIIGRALLRWILSRYVNVSTTRLRFDTGKRGKPFIAQHALQFNLSHSHDKALLAVTPTHEIGIDIEYVQDKPDLLEIAERFFSPSEYQQLKQLPPSQQIRGFYRAWSRKEAFIKMVGEGLFQALDSFDVELAPDKPARLLAVRHPDYSHQVWQLHNYKVDAAYCAAWAAAGDVPLQCESYCLLPENFCSET